tara:strand:- start:2736 stop:2999 length:264 start_codon:yes stop_codon:yes gene_type:complete
MAKYYKPTSSMRTSLLSKIEGGSTILVVYPSTDGKPGYTVEYDNIKNVDKYIAVLKKNSNATGYVHNGKLINFTDTKEDKENDDLPF